MLPSLANLARGYARGLVLGVLAGVALGRMPRLRQATNPVISFILTVPTVALLPIFLIVLGIGPQLQVGVIVVAVFFYVLVTTADAIRGIEPMLLDTADSFHIRGWRRLVLILVPSAVPAILSAARITLSISVLVMVVSEMVGASRGIGAVTLLAQQSFAYDQMWAGMLLLALIGIVLNAALPRAPHPHPRRLPAGHWKGIAMSVEPVVRVRDLHKVWATPDGKNIALAGVSFDVHAGQITALVGPSGAGKTTVLRIVAGLLQPTQGTAEVAGRRVNGPPEGVAMVFQDYSRSLLPWLTVLGNLTLPMRANGVPKAEAPDRARHALASVGLSGRERIHPRAALRRHAAARRHRPGPRVPADARPMDEPFASVDAQTRMDLEDLVLPPATSTT